MERAEQLHRGVICLHCGMPTPFSKGTDGESSSSGAEVRLRISLVRCTVCGKEAPYLGRDVVTLSPTHHIISCAA